MWICLKCSRIFQKTNQPHSCKKVPLTEHFTGKVKAKDIFDYLLFQIKKKIGKYRIISLPCCIHLFGHYDFLAALAKKDRLEIRIALAKKVKTPRLKQAVPLSAKFFKNCFDIYDKKEIDQEFLNWIKESYFLKG